jgi:hypothetical protein
LPVGAPKAIVAPKLALNSSMPSTPVLIGRDRRILAGYRAGTSLLDLAVTEEVDPAVVRRVLCAAGISSRVIRNLQANQAARDVSATGALADPARLRAEYATKKAQ